MLLIPCPVCGPRTEIEFRYGGQAHIARPPQPSALSDDEWEGYLYLRSNPKGRHVERWRHTFGCGRFFNCIRDTVTDKIAGTYPAGQAEPEAGAAETGA